MKEDSQLLAEMFSGVRPKGDRHYGLVGDFTGRVDVPTKPGYKFVTLPVAGSGGVAIGVFPGGGQSQANVPVAIEQDPLTGQRVITGGDAAGYASTVVTVPTDSTPGPGTFQVPSHSNTHNFLGTDILSLSSLQLYNPVEIALSSTYGHVTVGQGVYFIQAALYIKVTTTDVDLTTYYPTAGARYVWVTLTTSKTVAVVAPDPPVTVLTNLTAPTTSNWIVCLVQLRAGQPVTWTDFVDFRTTNGVLNVTVGSGTANQVVYWTGTHSIAGDAHMTWDATYDQLVIGGQTIPVEAQFSGLTLTSETSQPNFISITYSDTVAVYPIVGGFKARGTHDVPTAVKSGDYLLGMFARGHNGTAWASTRIRMRFMVGEDWSVGNEGTYFSFWATPNASGTIAEVGRITNADGFYNLLTNTWRSKDYTLTAAKTGTVPVGTGTVGRVAEWVTDSNTLQASTLLKTGANTLTLDSSFSNTVVGFSGGGTSCLLYLTDSRFGFSGGGASCNLGLPDASITLIGGGASCSLTLPNADTIITGGGTLALGGFTLTVPGTGTAALGTGTATRVAAWSGTNTIAAGTIVQPAANVLTITNAAASTLALAITASKTLTLTSTGDFNLTVPATGTAALLGTANVFTAAQTVRVSGAESSIEVDADANKQATFYFSSATSKKWAFYRPANSNNFAINLVGSGDVISFNATGGHVTPGLATGTQNLGDGINYWADISYKTLTDRGCLGWFDKGVEMLDGCIVSDMEAIRRIRPRSDDQKTVYGAPMLDYTTLPKVSYKPEPGGADGAEMTSLFSIMLGALKELDKRIAELENKVSYPKKGVV